MTRSISILFSAFALIWVSAAPALAQITVRNDEESVIFNLSDPSVLSDFSFRDRFLASGFNILVADADLTFDEDGFLEFDVLGSDADANTINLFRAPSGRLIALEYVNIGETRRSRIARDIRVDVTDGTINPGFLFSSFQIGNRQTSSYGLDDFNFGIFIQDATRSGLQSVIFAFEDATGALDFDDLLIRATFTPNSVPEPGSLLMLVLALLGVALVNRKFG